MQAVQREHGEEGRVRELVARVRQLIERALLARELSAPRPGGPRP